MQQLNVILFTLYFGWIQVCLTGNLPLRYGAQYVASARSWTPQSVSFSRHRPYTNAGQLNYQRQDAAKYVDSSTTEPPKKMLFPDLLGPTKPSSQYSDSSFKPSPEIPVQTSTHLTETTKIEDVYNKFLLTSNVDSASHKKSPRLTKDTNKAVSLPTIEASELLDAMEHLVERLNDLELRISNEDSDSEKQETARSLVVINDSLTSTRIKLESDINRLAEKVNSLENRLGALEEFTREWVDPNVLAYDNLGKVNGKRGIGRICPHQFFTVDDVDPNSPCYHISFTPNYRKHWQDASSNCHSMGAKLAEPFSTTALKKLTDYLLTNRTDQIGGGYWTGGVNPGLTWLWPSSGKSLSEIDPDMWISGSDPSANDASAGKCLRLSYDRARHRYALQASDCQRYLYFICEYDFQNFEQGKDKIRLEKSSSITPSINSIAFPTETQQSTVAPTFSSFLTTTETPVTPEIVATTWRPETLPSSSKPKPAVTPVPIRRFSRPTSRPTIKTATNVPFSFRSTTSLSKTTSTSTTVIPPTPNYIGVIGFKGIDTEKQEKPLNLAILTDSLL